MKCIVLTSITLTDINHYFDIFKAVSVFFLYIFSMYTYYLFSLSFIIFYFLVIFALVKIFEGPKTNFHFIHLLSPLSSTCTLNRVMFGLNL